MLTIHHLGVSQSERIVWLCEELGVPYALKLYVRDPVTRAAPAEYRAIHPAGTAPVITDGDLTLSESGAIIEYIIAKYGEGRMARAPDHPEFASYLFWLHYANGSLMPAIMSDRMAAAARPAGAPIPAIPTRSERGLAMVEARLGQAPYFAGDELTAADVIMLFPLRPSRLFEPRDLTPYPNLRAWLRRISERPAYQRAMGQAEPGQPIALV
ncbi:glutathione S-transferase family protein [Phenylobacterium sp.]|uniref:glutathione S-transferase family protein n=1 Tax=Phenylobacterium sp. TaxID=1871053 RepID=UPI0027374855|nr:glutathione S-transferase family protein [Phenylobacterium sp.]MDP3658486.1 glutathione S-transferase family protein [Phenylobacterium sp.]